jgi:hypothetical protein
MNEHRMEPRTDRYAAEGSTQCAYCGATKFVTVVPGWPLDIIWYSGAGEEWKKLYSSPPCSDDVEHRRNIDAELWLDRLETVAGETTSS